MFLFCHSVTRESFINLYIKIVELPMAIWHVELWIKTLVVSKLTDCRQWMYSVHPWRNWSFLTKTSDTSGPWHQNWQIQFCKKKFICSYFSIILKLNIDAVIAKEILNFFSYSNSSNIVQISFEVFILLTVKNLS